MKQAIPPSSEKLERYVQVIWCYSSDSEHSFEKVLPTSKGQLLINLRQPQLTHWSQPGVVLRTSGPVSLQGILTQPVIIDTEQKREICGVQFTPLGLSAFMHDKASRFTDSMVNGVEVWGDPATILRQNLQSTGDVRIRFEAIQEFLLQRLIERPAEDAALEDWINALRSGGRVNTIRSSLGWSQRRLHDLFHRRIGVRPKLFARLERFSGSLAGVADHTPNSAHAADLQYSDQAHMSREFRHFSGTSPSDHVTIGQEIAHAHLETDKKFKTGESN